jgi:plasmid stabilization system protein ParE
MAYSLQIKEEAKKEIVEAAHWYAQISKGLEIRFITQLETVFNIILKNPKTYKRVYKLFRQAALKKFPYVVLYDYEDSTVIIYCVFHAKQNPDKKFKRLVK